MTTNATMTPVSALVAFSRPHTIAGTVVAVVVLYVLAATSLGLAPAANLVQLVLALVAAVATNVYIVGLNQLTDVEIDRINKPWLPLAAGSMSLSTGRALVGGSAVVALGLGAALGRWMLGAAIIGIVVGSIYSLPPFRFKRSHLLAAASITSVRAVVVNLFLFAHFQQVLGGGGSIPGHVWALTGMVVGLTIAIAWFKDLPDTEGDAAHDISTLVLTLGPQRVLVIGLSVLGSCYLALAIAGVVGLPGVARSVVVGGHLALLAVLGFMGQRVKLGNHQSIRRFYTGIWRLFVAEYVLFGLAALAA